MTVQERVKFDKAGIVREIKRFMEETGIKKNEIAIGFGGAMVMYGLRDHTDDLDLDIPAAQFEKFRHAGYEVKKTPLGECMDYDPVISLHAGRPKDVAKMDGINVYGLKLMLSSKRRLTTHPQRKPEKIAQDKRDIARLEEMIGALI